ncbi:MAG: sugar nucleotide-binding protein [Pseudomonadota bacterium]
MCSSGAAGDGFAHRPACGREFDPPASGAMCPEHADAETSITLLLFGPTSQVGLEIQRQSGPDAPFLYLARDRADLTDPEACADAIRRTRPAVVINAAGYRDEDERLAHLINAEAPGQMAQACAEIRAPFIQISTAEVFDGSGEHPRRPTEAPGPATLFGRSKLAGEEAIRASGGVHAIMRTSWVMSPSRGNIVKDVLARAQSGRRLSFDATQVAAPTPAYDLASACLIAGERLLEDKALSGTYHYQGSPHASQFDVATEVVAQTGLEREVVAEPASGPVNLRLDCTMTTAALGLRTPDWRTGLGFILRDLRALKPG